MHPEVAGMCVAGPQSIRRPAKLRASELPVLGSTPWSSGSPPPPCCVPGCRRYGDVYLAKWHNCEVAVKCLNPSLFFSGGDLSSINRAAIVDLVKEADMLGSLR